MLLARSLKEARKRRDLTQSELADLIGVAREAITAYETDHVRLLDDIIIRFATSL